MSDFTIQQSRTHLSLDDPSVVALVVDANFRLTWVSEAATTFFNKTKEELIGHPADQCLSVQGGQHTLLRLRKLVRAGKAFRISYQLPGQPEGISLAGSVSDDRYLLRFRKIPLREILEQELFRKLNRKP